MSIYFPLIALPFLLVTKPAQAATMALAGTLPTDLSSGTFQVTATVTGVTEAEHTVGLKDPQGPGQFWQRLLVSLPDVPDGLFLPHDADTAASMAAAFFVHEFQDHTEAKADDGTYSYVYFLQVDQTRIGALYNAADGTKKLLVRVSFYLGGIPQHMPIADSTATLATGS